MISPGESRTAAQALVDQLVFSGIGHVFCVPGESYLAVLDALHDRPSRSPSAARRAAPR